jgi:hypothetical protein
MRRAAFEQAGGYATTAPHAEDYELWLRLAELGSLDNVPAALVDRRVHGQSVSDRNSLTQEETVATLMARESSRLLGEPVPEEATRSLRAAFQSPGAADADSLRDAGRLVRRYFQAFVRTGALDRAQARAVRADAASRLRLLARAARRVDRRLSLELAGTSVRMQLGVRR